MFRREQRSLHDASQEVLVLGYELVEVGDALQALEEGAPRAFEHLHHEVGVHTRHKVDHLISEQRAAVENIPDFSQIEQQLLRAHHQLPAV